MGLGSCMPREAWRLPSPQPLQCVRGAPGRFGGLGPLPGVVSSPFSPSRPAFPALCVPGPPVRVILTLARWYAIPCGLCVPWARSGCPSGIPRVSFVFVCAIALSQRPRPPPPNLGGVARAPRAVPVLGAGRAVPRGPCPSACPASVLCSVWLAWGGGGPVPFPPYLAWGCALPVGWVCASGAFLRRGAWWGGGGGLCAVPPDPAAGGASGAGGRLVSVRPSAFPGQATKRVSLALLWPWRAWPPYRSGSCSLAVPGRGPLAPLSAGSGLLVHRGSCESRGLGAWRQAVLRPPCRTLRSCRGGGVLPSALGGVGGRRPRGLRVGGGSVVGSAGGGCAVAPDLPPPRGAACDPPPSPPSVAGASPPGVRIRPGS